MNIFTDVAILVEGEFGAKELEAPAEAVTLLERKWEADVTRLRVAGALLTQVCKHAQHA